MVHFPSWVIRIHILTAASLKGELRPYSRSPFLTRLSESAVMRRNLLTDASKWQCAQLAQKTAPSPRHPTPDARLTIGQCAEERSSSETRHFLELLGIKRANRANLPSVVFCGVRCATLMSKLKQNTRRKASEKAGGGRLELHALVPVRHRLQDSFEHRSNEQDFFEQNIPRRYYTYMRRFLFSPKAGEF